MGHYPDLQAAYGTDNAAAIRHWILYGLVNEGRRASAAFDDQYYLDNNPDLQQAFGKKNYLAALRHWFEYGITDGRQSAPDFNVLFYISKYPELGFGQDHFAAIDHWLAKGEQEGRQGVEKKSPWKRRDNFTLSTTKVVIPNKPTPRKIITPRKPTHVG